MTLFLLGLAIFFGLHIYSATRSRHAEYDLKKRVGYGVFMSSYSVISLIGFGLIIYGFGAAREVGVLYNPPVWTRHINLLLMAPALILLIASQLPAGWITKTTKHPMLLAMKVWALGHLLANGEINSVILFGSFLAYAVFDRIMVKRRGDNGPGPDVALDSKMDLISLVVGLAAWAAIAYWLHPILFGVPAIL